ncbi:Cell-division control histidine kinase PdhS [Pseudochrobactrum sp. MP213Fo]
MPVQAEYGFKYMQQHLDFMELIPLSGIRASLATRDAMLVLSHDLQTTLWATDCGAQLIGEPSAQAAIGQPVQLSPQTMRQILALDLSTDQPQTAMLRLAGSLHSALLQCTITKLPLNNHTESAILISAATANPATSLSLPHHYAVLLNADAEILQADAQFSGLQISYSTLSDLVVEAQDELEGVVKRRVRAGTGTIPAMLVKLDGEQAAATYLFITPKADGNATDEAAHEATPAPVEEDTVLVAENKAATVEDNAPARFIWKVDAETRFTEISPEFAAVVGKNAADIIGRKFSDVAKVFGFDHDTTIAALLNQRDTWSGKRIMWPVEGTDQRVAVDLAALPAFARDKEFTGFSGFGVVHPSLTQADPEAIGMALTSAPAPETVATTIAETVPETADETAAQAAARASEKIILLEALRASQKRQPDHEPEKQAVEAPEKNNTLTEIRPARPESGLSPTERNAFREIADRLRREVLQKTPKNQTKDIASAATSEPQPETAGTTGEPQLNDIDMSGDMHTDIPYPHDVLPANHNHNSERPKLVSENTEPRKQDEDDLHVLSGLPVPVLIHSADRLHFANQAFFDMTGYASLDDLRNAGGIDALFAPADDNDVSGMTLCLANGGRKVVEAHLQSVPWQGVRALMLSLLPELVLQADNDDKISQDTGRAAHKPVLVTVPQVTETEDQTQSAANDALHESPISDPAPDNIVYNNPVHGMQTELALTSSQVSSAKHNPTQPDFHALQTQIDELTSILDTATDGVVIIGQDGKIRSLNQSAAALFGYDVAELAGKSFAVLFAIESQRAAIDYIHGLSGDGVASLLNDGREVIGREAQGRFIPLFMTIGKLPASKGYCAVMRDITQWKRAEEELTSARQEAERASTHKTEFLARISHEIRTPLNAIIGFSELMAEEKFGPIGNDRYREYLRDIHRSGNHVLALVNDLLDISKIEAGALDLEFEAVALNDALAEAVALMQPQANRERVIIRSSFSAFLPDIVADARSIRQVALNLLSNAIRFTGQGGQVIVSTAYEADGQVVMRVRDTGIGMNQSELEQALKPFKQVSNHNSQTQTIRNADVKDWRSQGTGLGLPLTKAMVEANRAQFSIESAPEQGTTIEITFPSTRVLAE